ncbi:hypothetical protein CP533_5386 [Ophiocordyceps camponoti-saundersi (nom. inval.)]|nr:hypothetical protein CP533_5386 [Ophiocordyceps camponoti-saundersi (nom. inval.)]
MPRLPGAGSLKLLGSVASSLRPTTTATTTLIATCSLSTTKAQHAETSWVRENLWKGKVPGTEDPYTQSPKIEEAAAATTPNVERPPRPARIPRPIRISRLTVPPKRTEALTETAAAEADPAYVPAEEGQGLEEIDTLANWWDRPGHWGEESRFKGFAGKRRITNNAVIAACLGRAMIEAFALKETGHFDEWLAKPWNPGGRKQLRRICATKPHVLRAKQRIDIYTAISGDIRNEVEKPMVSMTEPEAKALLERWGPSWKKFPVGDQLKFVLQKRLYQLTGILIPDAKLDGITTMNGLLRAATKPEKPMRLATELRERGDLSELPNVTIHSRRVGLITKETSIGRWKVIEKELEKRGLPARGPIPESGLVEKQWLSGAA